MFNDNAYISKMVLKVNNAEGQVETLILDGKNSSVSFTINLCSDVHISFSDDVVPTLLEEFSLILEDPVLREPISEFDSTYVLELYFTDASTRKFSGKYSRLSTPDGFESVLNDIYTLLKLNFVRTNSLAILDFKYDLLDSEVALLEVSFPDTVSDGIKYYYYPSSFKFYLGEFVRVPVYDGSKIAIIEAVKIFDKLDVPEHLKDSKKLLSYEFGYFI